MAEQIRLLVIEDVPQVAAHMRQLLQAQSQIKMLDVVTAGERAVAAVSEFKPDVVIVDALLQGRVQGTDVAHGIRQAEPQVGVVMLTVPQNPVTENAERGIDSVLKMPFSGFDLTTIVRKTYEQRNGPGDARRLDDDLALLAEGRRRPHDHRLQPGGGAGSQPSGLPGRRLAAVQRPARAAARAGQRAIDRQPANRSDSRVGRGRRRLEGSVWG